MGLANSKVGGTGKDIRASRTKRGQCSQVPQYADRRAWALRHLYKVNVNDFPPQAYSARDAEEDILDCQQGVRLRHSWRIVSAKKIEELKSKDIRKYALEKYHGYPETMLTPRLLQLLPYTKLDAAIDVSYFRKYQQPFFIIDKATSVVRSRDGKVTRYPGQKGTESKYKYDRRNINKKAKVTKGQKKYNPKDYPLKTLPDGSVKRVIPCTVAPEMCVPGQKEFYSGDVGNVLKRAALLNSKQRKDKLKMLQTTHAKKIQALNKKIASAPAGVKNRLVKQRQNMQVKFRVGVAKAEQEERIQVQPKRSNEWAKKRAEMGKQKQAAKQAEQARKKQEEAERRAAAERKARENEALRKFRQKQMSQKQMSQKQMSQKQMSQKQMSQKKASKGMSYGDSAKLSRSRMLPTAPDVSFMGSQKTSRSKLRTSAPPQVRLSPSMSSGSSGRYSRVGSGVRPGSMRPFG